MGDPAHRNHQATHLYYQHPTAIHSGRYELDPRAAPLGYIPPSLSAPLHPAHARPHTFVLVHPLLQRARSNRFQPTVTAHAGYPTVIVSSQPQVPASVRESSLYAVKSPFTDSTTARAQPDGNNRSRYGVQHSASTMTPNGTATMGGRREDKSSGFRRSQRPSLVSHTSNSVPSTPMQTPRQYNSRSRSPSPNGGLGSHSPRSVSSEANGPMATLRVRRQVPCKYETNAAFGRRRMPYDSSDILEKPKDEPKKSLDPHEDEKLSGDMRELYDRLLPSADSTARRHAFVKKLERILHTEWPGNEFKVHVFGSSGNLLYTNESDVDICIQTPMKKLEDMHQLAEALDRHGMEKVVCIPGAKVRIVKVWDPELQLASDMNVNNTLALENTRMIKTYVQIDDRVRPLAMIVKYWTKRRIINDAAFGGTISSYTWICMILNFLQTRNPPILPSLHKLPYRKIDEVTRRPSQSDFADDLDRLKGFGKDNKESLGQLLFEFFRVYGYEVDYEKLVISVREGKLLTREEKMWHLQGLKKEAHNRLCVEEPFNTERNLGNSADEFAWRGIHLEIRRAFDLLADHGQLEKACEQYEYPVEEKTTFKKPTATVKAVLQSAPSVRSSGRGGLSQRGTRGGYSQKNGYGSGSSGGRRASSGASFGANRPPFLHNNPLAPMEYGMASRGLNEQLHDQLYQQYLSLEMQSNNLRQHLIAQQRVQQAQQAQAAQMHAHAIAQAQAQAQGHNRGPGAMNSSPQKSPYLSGPASPQLSEPGIQSNTLYQQYLYHYPNVYDPAYQSGSVSQDAPRTNPSSPSLNSSVLRRSVHRSSNASETASIRSQSQPARVVPQPNLIPGYAPMPQYLDPSHYTAYAIPRSTQELSPTLHPSATSYSSVPAYTESAVLSDQSTPKEYVGYYVAEQPQARPQLQEYSVAQMQIPSYNELIERRRRVSQEVTQPLLNTAMRRLSRSPSPLSGHSRSYSTGVTPPPGATSQRKGHTDPSRPLENSGPVVVNGSLPIRPRESGRGSEAAEPFPTLDPSDTPALGIYVGHHVGDSYQMSSPEQHQQYEELRRQDLVELANSTVMNGSRDEVSPFELNGLTRVSSGGNQSFPTLERWPSSEPVTSDTSRGSPEESPARAQAPQWQPVSYTNGVGRIDTNNAPRPPPQEIKSAGLPLLSPVFEARTPSPTASRHNDAHKLQNGAKSQSKENNHHQRRRASHTQAPALKEDSKDSGRGNHQRGHASNDRGGKPNVGSSSGNAGSWQSSKKSKRKKAGNKGGEQKPAGEPLPANAAERKGG